MTNFRRYFVYRIRKAAPRTGIFALIAAIFIFSVLPRNLYKEEYIYRSNSGLLLLAVVLAVAAVLIPILENACFKNRRNLDTLFFFPISRLKMASVHFLTGLCELFFIYTVSFLTSYLYLLANTDYFALGYMFPFFFLSFLAGVLIYSFVSFFFSLGNTSLDGILFTILWFFLLFDLLKFGLIFAKEVLAVNINDPLILSHHPGFLFISAPLWNLKDIFSTLIEINRLGEAEIAEQIRRLTGFSYMYLVWGAVAAATAFGYFFQFRKKEAHAAGDISESYFGYKTLIPFYGYTMLFSYADVFPFSSFFTFVAMFVVYCIYRKSVKLRKQDLILFAVGILPLFIGLAFVG